MATGHITKFEIKDKPSKTATIQLDSPGNPTFRLSDDNDTSFAAMAALCADVVGTPKTVTVQVVGSGTEIDTLSSP
jgi:hypothetical protein